MVSIINNRRGRLKLPGNIELTPGVNSIDKTVWQKCEHHCITQHYLLRGDLIVAPGSRFSGQEQTGCDVSPSRSTGPGATRYEPESPPLPLTVEAAAEVRTDPTGSAAANGPGAENETDPWGLPVCIDNMRVREVVAITRATDNVRALRQLLTRDSRAHVVRAVEQRIAELKG